MNLGERIYTLRSEKSLYQGDLAEMLNVSRQSISKWENNSAVPDLDKIIKLSEIFGVSIDTLVKGGSTEKDRLLAEKTGMTEEPETTNKTEMTEAPEMAQTMEEKEQTGTNRNTYFPPRMIVGTILFCMAFLVTMIFLAVGGGLVGLVLSLPLIGCGTICFVCKQNIGLWCCWLLYILLEFYMRLATGIHPGALIGIIKNSVHYGHTWIIHGAVSLVLLILLLTLIIVTLWRFRNSPFANNRKNLTKLIVSWSIFVVLQVVFLILPSTGIYSRVLIHILSVGSIFQLVYSIVEWCRNIAFVYALTNTVRYIRTGKLAKKGEIS